MTLYMQAIITGIAVGSIYALIAVGVTQIFKVTRILNFAHAAFVLWGAYLYCQFSATDRIPVVFAAMLACSCTAGMGVVIEFLVFRIGRRATIVNKIIMTFGALNAATALVIWVYGLNPVPVNDLIPQGGVAIGGTQVAWSQVANLGLAILAVLGIGAFLKFTRLGLLTRAQAEDSAMAELLGARARLIGAFNWALAAGIGGLAGVLIANIGPFTNDQFLDYFVIAVLATILGGLQSLPLAVIGALILGVLNNVSTIAFKSPNSSDLVLFIAVAILVLVKRNWPNELTRISWTKPTIIREGAPIWTLFYEHVVVLTGAWIALCVAAIGGIIWAQTGGEILIYAVASISMIPVLGWIGQVTLAQGGLMCIAAYTMGTSMEFYHLNILVAMLLGIVAGGVFGAFIGAITSRLSFVLTAVTTLAFTNAMQWLVQTYIFHSLSGQISVQLPAWLNTALRQYWFFLFLGLMTWVLLSSLRRSSWGTRFLSIKTAPVMAEHFGVNPIRLRIYAFAISGVIAGLAGCMYTVSIGTIVPQFFTSGLSLLILQYAVIGGMGAVWGPFIATISFIGVPQLLNLARFGALPWPQLLGGVGVIQLMAISPDGVVAFAKPPTHRVPGTRVGKALANRFHYMPMTVTYDYNLNASHPASANGVHVETPEDVGVGG